MSQWADSEVDRLLTAARDGSSASLGRLLALYAKYLKLQVAAQLDKRLQTRLGASDVVQQAFFEAHRDFDAFRGTSPAEFVAWLKRIVSHNMLTAVEQHLAAEKRDVRREVRQQSMSPDGDEPTLRLEQISVPNAESPSECAVRHEQELQLADALAALPPDYRDVIVLRQFDGLPFDEVARRMQRSTGAVRMLWLRALGSLRTALARPDDTR